MEDYLGPVKTKKDDLFLKLVKRVRKPDYTMHFMEDRNGRKAMFYNYKGLRLNRMNVAFSRQRLQNIVEVNLIMGNH